MFTQTYQRIQIQHYNSIKVKLKLKFNEEEIISASHLIPTRADYSQNLKYEAL